MIQGWMPELRPAQLSDAYTHMSHELGLTLILRFPSASFRIPRRTSVISQRSSRDSSSDTALTRFLSFGDSKGTSGPGGTAGRAERKVTFSIKGGGGGSGHKPKKGTRTKGTHPGRRKAYAQRNEDGGTTSLGETPWEQVTGKHTDYIYTWAVCALSRGAHTQLSITIRPCASARGHLASLGVVPILTNPHSTNNGSTALWIHYSVNSRCSARVRAGGRDIVADGVGRGRAIGASGVLGR